MKRFFSVVLVALCLTTPIRAGAQDSAITGVIQSQLDAFLRDDFATAFTFASPGIRSMFQTPERFGLMVRQGYPMVWRPSDVRFLELETINGRLWQKVMITDAAGAVHLLAYQMVETSEGWQINGVQLLQAPEVGA